MKTITRLLLSMLLCVPALVSCYDQVPASGDDVQARCVTVDDGKNIIYEAAGKIQAKINEAMPDDLKAGDTFSPMEGMKVTILSVTDDTRTVGMQIDCDACDFTLLKSVITGSVKASLVSTESGFSMTFNTDPDQTLNVTGQGLVDAAVELKDLRVYVDAGAGSGFTGTMIINGTEYTLNELITMQEALAILAQALGKVSWADVAERMKEGDTSTGRFALPLGTIYNQGGLKINLALELNLTEPGAILTFTFDNYALAQNSPSSNQTLSGDMEAFVTFHEFPTVLKIVANTGDEPLYVNTGILGIRVPLAFRDVTLYYDILAGGLADDPAPSGTIYLAGIPVGLDSIWFELLLSLFQ